MSGVNALLEKRLNKKEKSSKMEKMANASASGNLTTFSGLFSISDLNHGEKDHLEALLHEYASGAENISRDLNSLITISSEVKAINNQAAILHGERIKKAHTILTRYRDGAFTSWLVFAYGNRQTPYNFMQYYEFHEAMPRTLHPQIEQMPRQAIYTLASREGSLNKKRKIVENYNGETKGELLGIIREAFPLSNEDKRKQDVGESAIRTIERLCESLRRKSHPIITKNQKKVIFELVDHLCELVDQCKTR